VEAFLRIRFSKGNDCFKLFNKIGNHPSVIGAWAVTDPWDAIFHVRGDRLEAISDFRELFASEDGIDEIETEAVLNDLHLYSLLD